MRSAPPSRVSLLGLVRHLTDVERSWLRRRFDGQVIAPLYSRADSTESELR
ncbi:MAG: DinB family protein [Actinomycetota bacterium]|nr:DinB family protein [Actinomycetota bacterium]